MRRITEKQVKYITGLGYTGQIPESVEEGSLLIAELISKRDKSKQSMRTNPNFGHSNIMVRTDMYCSEFDAEEEEEYQMGILGIHPDDFGNN